MTPYQERLKQADPEALSPHLREIQNYFLFMDGHNRTTEAFLDKKASGEATQADEQAYLKQREEAGERFKAVKPIMGDLSYQLEFIPDPNQSPLYNQALSDVHERAFHGKTLEGLSHNVDALREMATEAGAGAEWQQFASKYVQIAGQYQEARERDESGDGIVDRLKQFVGIFDDTTPTFDRAHYNAEMVEALQTAADIIASKRSGQEMSAEAKAWLEAPVKTPEMRGADEQRKYEEVRNRAGSDTADVLFNRGESHSR